MKAILGLTALYTGCVLGLLGAGAGWADPASAPEAGVWQKHQYNFNFMGFTSTYSCDGLADKLKVLLTAAGARKDSKAEPGACANGFGRPDKFARATLTFYTLAPDSEAANGGSSGDQAAVSGSWRTITLGDRQPSTLHVGDCEAGRAIPELRCCRRCSRPGTWSITRLAFRIRNPAR